MRFRMRGWSTQEDCLQVKSWNTELTERVMKDKLWKIVNTFRVLTSQRLCYQMFKLIHFGLPTSISLANVGGASRLDPQFVYNILTRFDRCTLCNSIQRGFFIIWYNYQLGFGGGSFALCSPLYTVEIAEPSMRGALASLMQFMVTLGVAFVDLLNIEDFVHWNIISGICMAFPCNIDLLAVCNLWNLFLIEFVSSFCFQ